MPSAADQKPAARRQAAPSIGQDELNLAQFPISVLQWKQPVIEFAEGQKQKIFKRVFQSKVMQDQGLLEEGHEPTDEELRRFDKKRQNKKVSNKEWTSPSDLDSRIVKMKDGRTHLAYKAEHTIDLESEFILDTTVYTADQPDGDTLLVSVTEAQKHLDQAGADAVIEEVVADNG